MIVGEGEEGDTVVCVCVDKSSEKVYHEEIHVCFIAEGQKLVVQSGDYVIRKQVFLKMAALPIDTDILATDLISEVRHRAIGALMKLLHVLSTKKNVV